MRRASSARRFGPLRRLGLLLVLATAGAACATPKIVLEPNFPLGATRIYSLRAVATTTVDTGTERSTERTVLEAESTITVIAQTNNGTKVRVEVVPSLFTRDGTEESREPQTVELTIAADGSVREVLTIEGLPANIAGVEDLAPLVGVSLPSERLRLGQRWRRQIPPPGGGLPVDQSGRVAGLATVGGYDAVLLEIGMQRPLRRERTVDDRTLALIGTESSMTHLSFALAERFPVRIEIDAEGRFTVEGAPGAGAVSTRSNSTLELLDRTTSD